MKYYWNLLVAPHRQQSTIQTTKIAYKYFLLNNTNNKNAYKDTAKYKDIIVTTKNSISREGVYPLDSTSVRLVEEEKAQEKK